MVAIDQEKSRSKVVWGAGGVTAAVLTLAGLMLCGERGEVSALPAKAGEGTTAAEFNGLADDILPGNSFGVESSRYRTEAHVEQLLPSVDLFSCARILLKAIDKSVGNPQSLAGTSGDLGSRKLDYSVKEIAAENETASALLDIDNGLLDSTTREIIQVCTTLPGFRAEVQGWLNEIVYPDLFAEVWKIGYKNAYQQERLSFDEGRSAIWNFVDRTAHANGSVFCQNSIAVFAGALEEPVKALLLDLPTVIEDNENPWVYASPQNSVANSVVIDVLEIARSSIFLSYKVSSIPPQLAASYPYLMSNADFVSSILTDLSEHGRMDVAHLISRAALLNPNTGISRSSSSTGEVEETDFKIDTEIGYEAAQYLWSEYVSGFMDEGREDPPPEWPFIFRRDMFEGRVDTYLERLYDLWSPMTCAHPVLKTIMLDSYANPENRISIMKSFSANGKTSLAELEACAFDPDREVSAEAIGILHGIEKNLNINGLYTGSGSILLYARRADGSWFRDEYAPEQLRASAAQVLARVKKDT